MPVNLGDPVKDIINGHTGYATERMRWLYGCSRILIAAKKVGVEDLWFDEQRVTKATGKRIAVAALLPCDVDLGDEVKDSLTGFSGIATGRADSFTGHVSFVVEAQKLPKDKGEQLQAFPVQRLIVVKKSKPPISQEAAGREKEMPGGPQHDPKRSYRKA